MKLVDETVIGTKVRCYDAGPRVMDRYTILYMSHPSRVKDGRRLRPGMCSGKDPRGYSGHLEAHSGPHLGDRIAFAELPEAVRRMVRNDLMEGGR